MTAVQFEEWIEWWAGARPDDPMKTMGVWYGYSIRLRTRIQDLAVNRITDLVSKSVTPSKEKISGV